MPNEPVEQNSAAGRARKRNRQIRRWHPLWTGGKVVGVLGSVAGAVAKVARFAGPFALVAGAYELFQNWESITGVFEQIGNSESVMKLGAAFTQLWSALSPLGTAMGNFIDGLMRLMGMDPANSSFFNGITWMIDKFTALIQVITAAVNKFNEFTGLQEAPGGKIGTQTGKTRQVGRGMSFVPNAVYGPERPAAPDAGPIPADISAAFAPIDASAMELNSAGGALQQAASMLSGLPSAIVSAIKGITITPTVNVAGGASSPGKAAAPAPRVSNGQQYNGGN